VRQSLHFFVENIEAGNVQSMWREGRDEWYHELMREASASSEPLWMDAEDQLFMLYTSGSTGELPVRMRMETRAGITNSGPETNPHNSLFIQLGIENF
jgi:acyl-coenzyme A synthetase/AMP-(fatty) acid ligase